MVGGNVRAFGAISVTVADWPIIVIEFPEKRVPDADLHSLLAHIEQSAIQALKNGEKLFVITDVTRMREIAPASQRRFTGEWTKRTARLMKTAVVGGATVTPSALLRGMITAVYWIHPSPTPTCAVQTRRDAMLKGIQMLEAERVLLSPRLIAYRDKTRGIAAD